MLITEEVEVGLCGKNIKYYESKGYKIPKHLDKRGRESIIRGTKIKVKIEDLTKSSNVKVIVECDCPNCPNNNPYLPPILWDNYKKCVKEDGKYYCHCCSMRLYGGEKLRKTKLSKGNSFYDWCIQNNEQDILHRWDYELNHCNPNEISFGTGEKYYFKCPRGIHKSELKYISNFTSGQRGAMLCKACNSFAQWGIDNLGEDFLDKYWDYEKNTANPWEIEYGAVRTRIWLFCQDDKKKVYHGSYDTTPNNYTSGNIVYNRCPYCSKRNGRVHPLDSLGALYPQMLKLWSNKNNENTVYMYKPLSMANAWWKCENSIHEDYSRSINSSTQLEFRCPDCVRERRESMLQEKVRLYLESLGYTVLHEYNTLKCVNPKTKMILPYDNQIEDLKLIIEVNGSQHYKMEGFNVAHARKSNTTPEYELYMRRVKDRYKRMWAKSKGYNYLEISYKLDNKNKDWKKILYNKILEITNKM